MLHVNAPRYNCLGSSYSSPQPHWHFILCLPCFCRFFSVEASCVAMLIPNNVFDYKTRGESSVDFAANCTFTRALVEKMEFCQYCPPFLCLLPIFNSPVIAFHFAKGTVLLFHFFNCMSCPDLLRWRVLMGMPCCFGSRGQLGINNEGKSLLGEAVPLWAQRHTFFHGACPDDSSLPIRNSIFFGLPWNLKSIPHNISLALCFFIPIVVSCALLLTHLSCHYVNYSYSKITPF